MSLPCVFPPASPPWSTAAGNPLWAPLQKHSVLRSWWWMRRNHPYFSLLFSPKTCTSQRQSQGHTETCWSQNSKEGSVLLHSLKLWFQQGRTDTHCSSASRVLPSLSHRSEHRCRPALHSKAAGATGFQTEQGTGFSEHNGMKLEISYRKIGKSPNTWKLNKAFLNNPCIKEEVSREIRKYLEANENKM